MAYDIDRRPGAWVKEHARNRARLIWAGLAVFGLADLLLMVGGVRYSWGPVPILLFLALALYLRPYAERYSDKQINWAKGGLSEERVGKTLEQLRRSGWIVMHDIKVPGRANIDHIVSGPNGVFVVETKHKRYEVEHLGRVKGQAAWLSRQLGHIWVIPVIALDERVGRTFTARGVAIVPRHNLLDWLGEQHNKAVDFDRLARFADSL